jgi:hypothetical protein
MDKRKKNIFNEFMFFKNGFFMNLFRVLCSDIYICVLRYIYKFVDEIKCQLFI